MDSTFFLLECYFLIINYQFHLLIGSSYWWLFFELIPLRFHQLRKGATFIIRSTMPRQNFIVFVFTQCFQANCKESKQKIRCSRKISQPGSSDTIKFASCDQLVIFLNPFFPFILINPFLPILNTTLCSKSVLFHIFYINSSICPYTISYHGYPASR